MDTVDRIFALLSESRLDQKEFAKRIGVIPQTITDWKNRKSASYTKHLLRIAAVLGTTPNYLLTGQEPKNRRMPAARLSAAQAELLGKFARLTPEEQREVLAIIDYKLSQKTPHSSGQAQEAT